MSPEDRVVALQAMKAERHGLDRDAKLSLACRIVKVVFTGLIKGEVAMRVAHWRLRQQEGVMGAKEQRTVAARRHRDRMAKARQQESALRQIGLVLVRLAKGEVGVRIVTWRNRCQELRNTEARSSKL